MQVQQRLPLKRSHRYFVQNRPKSHAVNPNIVYRWLVHVLNQREHYTIIIKKILHKNQQRVHHRRHMLHQRYSYQMMDSPEMIHVYHRCTQNDTTPHQLHQCTI